MQNFATEILRHINEAGPSVHILCSFPRHLLEKRLALDLTATNGLSIRTSRGGR
jgi:hypothetical protein